MAAEHDPQVFTPEDKHQGWVGDVWFGYSRDYDNLRIEKGYYQSEYNEVNFYGERESMKGVDAIRALRQAVEQGGGYDFGKGMRTSQDGTRSLLNWLSEQMKPYPAVEAKDVNTDVLNALESGVSRYDQLCDLLGINEQDARAEMAKLEAIGLARDNKDSYRALTILTRGSFLLRTGSVKAQQSDVLPESHVRSSATAAEDLNVVQF